MLKLNNQILRLASYLASPASPQHDMDERSNFKVQQRRRSRHKSVRLLVHASAALPSLWLRRVDVGRRRSSIWGLGLSDELRAGGGGRGDERRCGGIGTARLLRPARLPSGPSGARICNRRDFRICMPMASETPCKTFKISITMHWAKHAYKDWNIIRTGLSYIGINIDTMACHE